MAPTNHRAQGPEASSGGPEVTGTRRPVEGTRTPWACAPALTHSCLAGAGGRVRTQNRVPGCPPALCSSLGLCFQGQIQQRPASLRPPACGLQLPVAWGGGGVTTQPEAQVQGQGAAPALLRPLPVWPPGRSPCAHCPSAPRVPGGSLPPTRPPPPRGSFQIQPQQGQDFTT